MLQYRAVASSVPTSLADVPTAGSHGMIPFWEKAARDIDWFKPPKVTLDESKSPFNKWCEAELTPFILPYSSVCYYIH